MSLGLWERRQEGGRPLKLRKRKELSMDHNPRIDEEGGEGLQSSKAPVGGLFLQETRDPSSFGTGRKERGEGTKNRQDTGVPGVHPALFLLHCNPDGVRED